MKHKRILAVALSAALLAGVLTIPAAAHGGCHGGGRRTAAYPTCTVEDCNLGYRHSHDGVTYCGHTSGDGHDHDHLSYRHH